MTLSSVRHDGSRSGRLVGVGEVSLDPGFLFLAAVSANDPLDVRVGFRVEELLHHLYGDRSAA